MAKPVPDSLPVNAGMDTCSYSSNSYYQRLAADAVKSKIDSAILENLDVKTLSSPSNTFYLADLGCAAGPNTFIAMQNLINTLQQKYISQTPSSKKLPEFQVFFNDQISNNFNMLFTSLPPERGYFAAGVPGSFHGRLFPQSSLHFVYTSIALHWMSKAPEILNKGRIHYTSAADEVVEAYANQFGLDMGNFLDARAKEIEIGGMMVIIMPGIPDGMSHSQLPSGLMFDLMASCFMDMVNVGLITEDQVDSFNLPLYTASPMEMAELVEKNENFSIETMELTDPASWMKGPINVEEWITHIRVAMKGMFIKHFETQIIDQMFDQLIHKLIGVSDHLESCYREKTQLFAILKRK